MSHCGNPDCPCSDEKQLAGLFDITNLPPTSDALTADELRRVIERERDKLRPA